MNSEYTIPRRFPATIPDRAITLLWGVRDYTEWMIQLELEFRHKLDVERLSQAIDLTLDAEPILGCRWVPHWRKPFWERLDRTKRHSFLLVDSQDDYEAFKVKSIDSSMEPQIRACLWQPANGDHLLLKVSHFVTDAAGAKKIASMISSIYDRLAHDPSYQPEPNLKGSRGIWQVLRHIPWYAYPKIQLNYLQQLRSTGKAPHGTYALPLASGLSDPVEFVHRFIPANRVSFLTEYGRAHNATLNDVMLAAFIRALGLRGDWDGHSRFMVNMPVDLRQWYLPSRKAEGICNLSWAEYVDFGSDIGPEFSGTLQHVCAVTQSLKENWIGLDYWVGWLPYLLIVPHSWGISFYRKATLRAIDKKNVPISLTNMGPIDPSSVTFDNEPSNALLLPPIGYPPLFAAGLSGYAGNLTISAGAYLSQKNIVENFFDHFISELPD